MNKVICNHIKIIHRDNVISIDDDNIILHPGKEFISLRLESPAIYTGQCLDTDAGVVFNETLSANIRYNQDAGFLNIPLIYYILRIYSDSGSFIMGLTDYPAVLTYSTDKIFADLTFKSSRPM
ncbi:hypothetical protein IR083_10265 [Dysgonomonas sp. GY75]|uniref:hypothetical protein n=1 Tax=Dysgonomonas sp. GY75 TaxID=2780419 RepID=UPI00188314C4|nr:hypothetical protein [Dysgonomonas sp. GY75]MBF0649205.1 hypothetical protein [Dysgonomonas sp. GY75]